jgi:hypothetical protein
VLHFIDTGVDIHSRFVRRKGFVEVCFLDIGAESIDRFQRGGRVEGERIWADAYDGPVTQMGLVIGEMSRSAVGVVCEVDIGDFR